MVVWKGLLKHVHSAKLIRYRIYPYMYYEIALFSKMYLSSFLDEYFLLLCCAATILLFCCLIWYRVILAVDPPLLVLWVDAKQRNGESGSIWQWAERWSLLKGHAMETRNMGKHVGSVKKKKEIDGHLCREELNILVTWSCFLFPSSWRATQWWCLFNAFSVFLISSSSWIASHLNASLSKRPTKCC